MLACWYYDPILLWLPAFCTMQSVTAFCLLVWYFIGPADCYLLKAKVTKDTLYGRQALLSCKGIGARPSTAMHGLPNAGNTLPLQNGTLPAYMLKLIAHSRVEQQQSSSQTTTMRLPIVAVIGRPNTGKSTIVNRISESFQVGARTSKLHCIVVAKGGFLIGLLMCCIPLSI